MKRIEPTRLAEDDQSAALQITAKSGEILTLRVQGPGGLQGTVGVTSGCGTVNQTVTITTTPLPNHVTRYEAMSLNWSFQRAQTTTWIPLGSTYHHVFVSYGTPTFEDWVNGIPTQWRMKHLCGAGDQATTLLQAIEGMATLDGGPGIQRWLDADPPLNGCPLGTVCVDTWHLMAGIADGLVYRGECDEQARFMVRARRWSFGKTSARRSASLTTAEPLPRPRFSPIPRTTNTGTEGWVR